MIASDTRFDRFAGVFRYIEMLDIGEEWNVLIAKYTIRREHYCFS